MAKRIPVWIDCDTGVDDAMALICAAKTPEIEIIGVSTVAGNVPLEDTFRNTRDVLSLLEREDIKVYKGCDKPLEKELFTAKYFHGHNGLGGVELELSKAVLEEEKPWDALYKKAKELNGELVIIAIGPLSNIATAFIKYPDLYQYIKTIAIMGGGIKGGNITEYAEFNYYVDPKAAKIVFETDIPKIMCGLDVTHKAIITYDELNEAKEYHNKLSDFLYESTLTSVENSKKRNKDGLYCHDVCPVFYLVHPEWFKSFDAYVSIVEEGEKEGQSVSDIDKKEKKHKPNTRVILDVNRKAFIARMLKIYQEG